MRTLRELFFLIWHSEGNLGRWPSNKFHVGRIRGMFQAHSSNDKRLNAKHAI